MQSRLLKWVKARRRIGPRAAAHRLNLMTKENPTLFAHWYPLRAPDM
ncbi:MAG: reverse transcriptase [Verrucomicrobiaceae bacterium]|nr:MAG: reverse transcriptase [Verrucomicrobiaceae bacterium]